MNKKILVALSCASTMAFAAASDLIDDFEDGNGVANTDKGTYTDMHSMIPMIMERLRIPTKKISMVMLSCLLTPHTTIPSTEPA